LVTYPFPPLIGTSGTQRVLAFMQGLVDADWQVTVLTCTAGAYPETSTELEKAVPSTVRVLRAPTLDIARHVAIRGRYLRSLALPDRWNSWWLSGLAVARSKLWKTPPDVVWSTYPIATAHALGRSLAHGLRAPWVADFRDPMTEPGFPTDPRVHRAFSRIERHALQEAARITVTTPSLLRLYSEYCPEAISRLLLLPNGFDESVFAAAAASLPPRTAGNGRVTVVHSGYVYPDERNPTELFLAIRELKASGRLSAGDLRLVLRGAGEYASRHADLQRLGIDDIVEVSPPLTHVEAIREMLAADGLLLLQGRICNNQIPAKLYEYLRAQRPILALTERDGDTARALIGFGSPVIAPLEDRARILEALPQFLAKVRSGAPLAAELSRVSQYSRQAQARRFTEVLEEVASSGRLDSNSRRAPPHHG